MQCVRFILIFIYLSGRTCPIFRIIPICLGNLFSCLLIAELTDFDWCIQLYTFAWFMFYLVLHWIRLGVRVWCYPWNIFVSLFLFSEYIKVFVYLSVYVCVCGYICVCIFIYMYVCFYRCICVWVFLYVYLYCTILVSCLLKYNIIHMCMCLFWHIYDWIGFNFQCAQFLWYTRGHLTCLWFTRCGDAALILGVVPGLVMDLSCVYIAWMLFHALWWVLYVNNFHCCIS